MDFTNDVDLTKIGEQLNILHRTKAYLFNSSAIQLWASLHSNLDIAFVAFATKPSCAIHVRKAINYLYYYLSLGDDMSLSVFQPLRQLCSNRKTSSRVENQSVQIDLCSEPSKYRVIVWLVSYFGWFIAPSSYTNHHLIWTFVEILYNNHSNKQYFNCNVLSEWCLCLWRACTCFMSKHMCP